MVKAKSLRKISGPKKSLRASELSDMECLYDEVASFYQINYNNGMSVDQLDDFWSETGRFVMKNLPVTVTDEEVEAMLRSISEYFWTIQSLFFFNNSETFLIVHG